MNFNEKDTEKVVGRSLVLECFDMTLKQNTESSPVVIQGVGSLEFEPDGQLGFKLYDASKSSSSAEMSGYFFDRPEGLVPEARYYSLSTIDEHGVEWVHPKVYIDGGLHATRMGIIVSGNVPYIRAKKLRRNPIKGSGAEIHIRGQFNLPFNDFKDGKYGYTSLSRLRFNLRDVEVVISQFEGHLEIELGSDSEFVTLEFVTGFLEGLGIAIGRDVTPAFYQVVIGEKVDAYIHGGGDIKGVGVIEPMVEVFYNKEHQLVGFLNAYVESRSSIHDHLVSYWNRLYRVPDMVTEVAALVLTVNIEGMVKNYFSQNRTLPPEILQDICETKRALKFIQLPDYTSSRINSYLANLGRHGTAGILKELAKEGVIKDVEVKSWSALRHSLAHADNISSDFGSINKMVSDIHNCINLFYRLIGVSVGFDINEFVKVESQ